MSVTNLKGQSSLHCLYADEVRNNSSQTTFVSDVAICVLNAVAILLNLPANGFVIYTYLKSRSRQPICNTLLFMMATFDLLQGIISQPVFLTIKILEAQKDFVCWLENASSALLSVFAGYAFIMGTLVLTSERLFAIIYPIRHRLYISKRRIIITSLSLFVVWTICIICLPQIGHSVCVIIVLCIIVLGLAYPVAVYVKIYSVCRKSKAFINANASNKTRDSNLKSEERLTDGNHVVNGSNINTSEKRLSLTVMAKTKGLGNNSTNSTHRDGAISAKVLERNDLDHKGPSNKSSEIALPEIACSQHQGSVLEIVGDSTDVAYHPSTNVLNTKDVSLESSLTIKGIHDEATMCTLEVRCEFEDQSPCQKLKSHCVEGVKRAQNVCQKFTLNRKEKRIILRMLCIVGALYICQLPVLLLFLFAAMYDVNFFFVKYLFPWGMTFSFVNSIVNPFIYCYRNDHFWIRKSRQSRCVARS